MLSPGQPLVESLTLEAGTFPTAQMFLADGAKYGDMVSFQTDMSTINVRVPGEYPLVINVGDKEYSTLLVIQDRTAPTATAVE